LTTTNEHSTSQDEGGFALSDGMRHACSHYVALSLLPLTCVMGNRSCSQLQPLRALAVISANLAITSISNAPFATTHGQRL
jgi:hypothetical protein